MLSIDNKVFEETSAVRKRIISYGMHMDELHVVAYTRQGFSPQKVGKNIFLYPTNTWFRPMYFVDAFRIVRSHIKVSGERQKWIIDSQEAMTNLLGLFLKLFYRIRLNVQIHTDFRSSFFIKESFTNALRFLGYTWGVFFADAIRVVSERIQESLGTTDKNKLVTALPIFVEESKKGDGIDLHAEYPQFKHIVVMVSRLEKEKDIITALKAMRSVLEKMSDVGLVIAGDGSQRGYLEAYAKKHALDTHVVFLGWQDDVASLFRSADTYLLTSQYEGYARTLVEAAQGGCALITTPVGISEYVFESEEGASIVPIGDADAIAEQIIRLAKDTELHRKLAAGAYNAYKAHAYISEEDYVDQYVAHFKKCLSV